MPSKRTTVAAAAAGVAIAAGAGVAVAAPGQDERAPARFQANLAEELGVTPQELSSAVKAAGGETVDELRASGQLDAERGERLKQAIERGRGVRFGPFGHGRRGGPAGVPGKALADQLGVEPGELREQLRAGRTPADLIAEAGKDPATVEAAIRTAVRERLDAAVQAQRLTAEQADERASRVAERLSADEPLRGGPGGRGLGGRHRAG